MRYSGAEFFYLASAFIGWLLRRRRIPTVHRILIYKLDHLGDMLMATPVLRALRERFPEAEITIVIGEWNRDILQGNPNVDRILVYNSSRYTRQPYTAHRFEDLKQQLGDWKPDVVIGLRDDWRTLLDSLVSRHWRTERGSSHMREYIERRRNGKPQYHEHLRLAGTIRDLGISIEERAPLDYYITDEERHAAAEFLRANGITPPFAMLQCGATNRLREWLPERFAELARQLHRDYRMQIVLVGGPSEAERCREVAAMIPELAPIDISGALRLRPFVALMPSAALYVGCDGGTMHIAAALGVPTVALFGPGPYHVFYPVGERVEAVSHLFPCAPCAQTVCIRPNDTCMQAISVEEVVEAANRVRRTEDGGRRR